MQQHDDKVAGRKRKVRYEGSYEDEDEDDSDDDDDDSEPIGKMRNPKSEQKQPKAKRPRTGDKSRGADTQSQVDSQDDDTQADESSETKTPARQPYMKQAVAGPVDMEDEEDVDVFGDTEMTSVVQTPPVSGAGQSEALAEPAFAHELPVPAIQAGDNIVAPLTSAPGQLNLRPLNANLMKPVVVTPEKPVNPHPVLSPSGKNSLTPIVESPHLAPKNLSAELGDVPKVSEVAVSAAKSSDKVVVAKNVGVKYAAGQTVFKTGACQEGCG